MKTKAKDNYKMMMKILMIIILTEENVQFDMNWKDKYKRKRKQRQNN